jgi:peptidoglycan hydrolase CwlO-like protein
MGDLTRYLKEYWAVGRGSYSLGKTLLNVLLVLVPVAALFGFGHLLPVPPAWASAAWLSLFVTLSLFFYWPFRMWKAKNAEIEQLRARKLKQEILDQISDLREKVVKLRIDMESDPLGIEGGRWKENYYALEKQIADKIEAFVSRAEAVNYRVRGNISRRLQSTTPHQLYIDLCIHDMDYLRQFVIDYSRGKDRHT